LVTLVAPAGLLLGGLVSVAAPARAQTPSAPASAGSTAGSSTGSTTDSTTAGLEPRPVRVVILVDESGSLSAADVDQEKQDAAILALGTLGVSSGSQVAVAGFGSSNAAGQSAVGPACGLIDVATADNQQSLLNCVDRLHPRTVAEGNDTDHVAALDYAVNLMNQPDDLNRKKIIFLLTDGRLDVSNSPQYGAVPEARNQNADGLLTDSIADARAAGAQIWPLGFGAADQAALDRFARGGSVDTCSRLPDAVPRATIVHSATDVRATLFAAFAAAQCASVTPFDNGTLHGGKDLELKVRIPEISTDGTLVVLKLDPRVTVRYFDPTGAEVPRNGTQNGSTFVASTQNGPVESLHIRNPLPGTWTVRLTAPAGLADQEVSAAAIWQGVLRSVISIVPPNPQAGTDVTVRVRLLTRSGVVTDPAALETLRFSARLSGAGFQPVPIQLADGGQQSDRRAHDGEYTGTVRVPAAATGNLQFLGLVDGTGVLGDERPLNTVVSAGPPPVTADVSIGGGTVAPGGTVHGTVLVDNVQGSPRKLGLQLVELSAGTLAEISPSSLELSSSGRTSVPFTITFASNSRRGPASGVVRVVEAANPQTVYADGLMSVTVRKPKPLAERLWPLWLLLVLALGAGFWWLRRRRDSSLRDTDVRGITVGAYPVDGELAVHELEAPDARSTQLRFNVRYPEFGRPELELANDDEDGWVLQRATYAGRAVPGVVVWDAAGNHYDRAPGEQLALGGGFELRFSDTRPGWNARGGPSADADDPDPTGPYDPRFDDPPVVDDDADGYRADGHFDDDHLDSGHLDSGHFDSGQFDADGEGSYLGGGYRADDSAAGGVGMNSPSRRGRGPRRGRSGPAGQPARPKALPDESQDDGTGRVY
jgi:von Willebrand factor type A domain